MLLQYHLGSGSPPAGQMLPGPRLKMGITQSSSQGARGPAGSQVSLTQVPQLPDPQLGSQVLSLLTCQASIMEVRTYSQDKPDTLRNKAFNMGWTILYFISKEMEGPEQEAIGPKLPRV